MNILETIEKENETLNQLWIDSAALQKEEAEKLEKAGKTSADYEKLNRMQEELASFAAYNGEKTDASTKMPTQFAEGVEVLCKGKRGTILRQDKKGSWIVAFGTLKMSCKENPLSFAPVSAQSLKPTVSVEFAQSNDDGGIAGASFGKSAERAQFELRLLGMRYEEAMKALERQIDLAGMQHLKSFSVVHGKGAGILQEGVHKYLKSCHAVEEFHFARPEEGGTGKTYVTLKD